jgi:hypothetical protein
VTNAIFSVTTGLEDPGPGNAHFQARCLEKSQAAGSEIGADPEAWGPRKRFHVEAGTANGLQLAREIETAEHARRLATNARRAGSIDRKSGMVSDSRKWPKQIIFLDDGRATGSTGKL